MNATQHTSGYESLLEGACEQIVARNGTCIQVSSLPGNHLHQFLQEVTNRLNERYDSLHACYVGCLSLGNGNIWEIINSGIALSGLRPPSMIDNFNGIEELSHVTGKKLVLVMDHFEALFDRTFGNAINRRFFDNYVSHIEKGNIAIIGSCSDCLDKMFFDRFAEPGLVQTSPFIYKIQEKIILGSNSRADARQSVLTIFKMHFGEICSEFDSKEVLSLAGTTPFLRQEIIQKFCILKRDGVTDISSHMQFLVSEGLWSEQCKTMLACFDSNHYKDIEQYCVHGTVTERMTRITSSFKGLFISIDNTIEVNGAILKLLLEKHFSSIIHSVVIQEERSTIHKEIERTSSAPRCSSTVFKWIHLSDTHFGGPLEPAQWPRIASALVDDVDRISNSQGSKGIDVIFFTGDMVQSGRKYADANDRMSKLVKSLGCQVFIPVPGNHDVIHPEEPYNCAILSLLELWNKHRKFKEWFWQEQMPDCKEAVFNVFQEYRSWFDKSFTWGKPSDLVQGLLPGDISTVIKKGDFSIGIVGLNTAFLQLQIGHFFNTILEVNIKQLHALCGDYCQWTKMNDVNFLLTHHPMEWFSEIGKDHFLQYIVPDFHFHLFGHMHENDFSGARHGSVQSIQGASLCGDREVWLKEGKKGKVNSFGYSYGELTLTENLHSYRLWPRRKKEREWRFTADSDAILGKELNKDMGTEPVEISRTRCESAQKIALCQKGISAAP